MAAVGREESTASRRLRYDRFTDQAVRMMDPADGLHVETRDSGYDLEISEDDRRVRLSEFLRSRNLPLNTRCGQRGTCNGCLVITRRGGLTAWREEAPRAEGLPAGSSPIRACQHRLPDVGGAAIDIPARSLLTGEPQAAGGLTLSVTHAHDPLWQQLPLPSRPTGLSELRHLAGRDRRVVTEPSLVLPREWPDPAHMTLEYRSDHWLLTDVASAVEPAPTGLAVDVGTTTVAMLLVQLATGDVLADAVHPNAQTSLGDDIVTRMDLCGADPGEVGRLHRLLVEGTLQPLIAEVMARSGTSKTQIRCAAVAGNSTMLHLLAGIDPSPMGTAPFTPRFLDHQVLIPGAGDPLAIALGGCIPLHLLPGAAAYVGADLIAGSLSTGLVYDEGPSLLVDVGTNGEIVLLHEGRLFGCATAAGPAFEAGGLLCGMRAVPGAVSHICLGTQHSTPSVEVIGATGPIGICGSAYVDFLAEGRAAGILTPMGRLVSAADAHEGPLVGVEGHQTAFRVVDAGPSAVLLITEGDIARLLQAKAALAAGILTLLDSRGLHPDEVARVYLAGSFGLHLSKSHAIACGLLPGFTPDQIEVVGNSSLAGAYLALVDSGALEEMQTWSRLMEVVELNLDPKFEDRYVDQLALL